MPVPHSPQDRPLFTDLAAILARGYLRLTQSGETVGAIIRGDEEIPPTKSRRESEDFKKAVAMLKEGGGKWKEVMVSGWSPATTSWIELVAFVPEDELE